MLIVHSYSLAVLLCILTMFCWGSWANTLKMEPRSYSFALYYWDQSIGYLLLPLIVGLTFGSFGSQPRSFLHDLAQATPATYAWAMLGGVVWNLANILFMSALDIAGMAVAYPIAIGIALVEGVVINYVAQPQGRPVLIFSGVAFILLAVILDALAYRNVQRQANAPEALRKGISLALAGGILMGLFYFLVQRSLAPNFDALTPGKFGPYAGIFIYALGSFISNLLFNTFLMSHPTRGDKVTYTDYFRSGPFKVHAIGALGGVINGIGVASNFVASNTASPAIAYGLGQGGTMIAAVWGILVWKETKGASRGTQVMIAGMFAFFLAGLIMLVASKL